MAAAKAKAANRGGFGDIGLELRSDISPSPKGDHMQVRIVGCTSLALTALGLVAGTAAALTESSEQVPPAVAAADNEGTASSAGAEGDTGAVAGAESQTPAATTEASAEDNPDLPAAPPSEEGPAPDGTDGAVDPTVATDSAAGGEVPADGSEPPPPLPDSARSDYNLKLRDIEERVNQLKEKIFQSKARLIQLQEVVLHGTISGAKAVLIHSNDMGSSFRLWRVQYALDGAPIFNRVDAGGGELDGDDDLEIFNGSIAPGNHQISVYLEYHGHGYGIFSYLEGYKFKIKSSYTFNAEEGKITSIRVVGYEKGGITTELKDRPSVRYDIETARELRKGDIEESESEGDQEG